MKKKPNYKMNIAFEMSMWYGMVDKQNSTSFGAMYIQLAKAQK